ncbi:MAG: hypothetical protein WC054_10160 [Candidatus Nanopelagicales bacterium]
MAHGLAAYTFEVHALNKSDPKLLGNFDEEDHEIRECFVQFAKQSSVLTAKKSNHVARINSIIDLEALGFSEKDRRHVTVLSVGAGEYNVASRIYQWDSDANVVADEPEFGRSKDHLEQVDLILGLVINPMSNRGWMFLHSIGSYSVKSKFTDNFDKWFRDKFPDYKVRWELVGDPSFYRKAFEEGVLRQVSYRRLGTVSDVIGTTESAYFTTEDVGTIATHVHPKRNYGLPKKAFDEIFDNAEKRKKLMLFGGVQYEEITLKVQTPQGNDVSIDVSEARVPRIKLNIDDDVNAAEADGASVEKAVIVAGLRYIDDLKGKISKKG